MKTSDGVLADVWEPLKEPTLYARGPEQDHEAMAGEGPV